jgi:hypothetical protein
MKRVFKPRERDTSEIDRKEKEKAEEQQRVEEARLKAIKQQERSLGVTLVAATPVKSKTVRPVVNRAGTFKSDKPQQFDKAFFILSFSPSQGLSTIRTLKSPCSVWPGTRAHLSGHI